MKMQKSPDILLKEAIDKFVNSLPKDYTPDIKNMYYCWNRNHYIVWEEKENKK